MPSISTKPRQCSTPSETESWATDFATNLTPGTFVALSGPLGAGKSVVARAIARYWGVESPMPSPTYSILAVYRGRCPIYHMDLYRLASVAELDLAGLRAYFESDGICLVEWGDKMRESWPESGFSISIAFGEGDNRTIAIERFGPHRSAS